MSRLYLWLFVIIGVQSCSDNDATSSATPIKFDKAKWETKVDGKYQYRNQMVFDLLNNHRWKGLTIDSVYLKLGQPDDREGAELFYHYDSKPSLGGLATAIETLVIELSADSTVKEARLDDGGWD